MGEEKGIEKKNSNIGLIILAIVMVLACIGGTCYYFLVLNKKSEPVNNTSNQNGNINKYEAYKLRSNSLENFDLYFLQLENGTENKIYSPLSIKYALSMLKEGSNGDTYKQLDNIVGDYNTKKYVNSENMSFANGIFVKDPYRNIVKDGYVNTLLEKYNAEVIYDDFTSADNINNWIKNKTLNLIDNMVDDVSSKDLVLVNALGIDMEWVKKIQSETNTYEVVYPHRKFDFSVSSLNLGNYTQLKFKDISYNTKGVKIGAVVNKYDIVKDIGEDKIRKTVGDAYENWINAGAERSCVDKEELPSKEDYLNEYIKEIKNGYKEASSSTDFMYYSDDDVRVFAKDLKEYNGTTLEYIGIMPNQVTLDKYIENLDVKELNRIIGSLVKIDINNFKEGYVTKVYGTIPLFDFEYNLDLMNDLARLGITDVFDSNKADLSNMSKDKKYISSASHKANIKFSNDGIKAGAATTMSATGSGNCGFDYLYDVPVIEVDLTFNKPYMFMIRDKDSGEVWFMGTVYEPSKYSPIRGDYE